MSTAAQAQGKGQIVPYNQRVSNVRSLLEKALPQIKLALPKHMNADRLARIALSSCTRNPKLFECDPLTLMAAVLQSAALGLEPDGALGEAYLIPYNGKVQFQVGYRGLMKLARNTGQVGAIGASVVRKRDVFEWGEGPDGAFKHVPFSPPVPDDASDLAAKEGGEELEKLCGPMTHAYAWAKLKDGTAMVKVMTRVEVLAIRGRSQAWQTYITKKYSCPWVTDPAAMWKKTAIKQLAKLMPQSPELARAVSLDSQSEAGLSQDFGDVLDTTAQDAPSGPPTTTGQLADRESGGAPPHDPATGEVKDSAFESVLDEIRRARDTDQLAAAEARAASEYPGNGVLGSASRAKREELAKAPREPGSDDR